MREKQRRRVVVLAAVRRSEMEKRKEKVLLFKLGSETDAGSAMGFGAL